jgi:hypothetical protein
MEAWSRSGNREAALTAPHGFKTCAVSVSPIMAAAQTPTRTMNTAKPACILSRGVARDSPQEAPSPVERLAR